MSKGKQPRTRFKAPKLFLSEIKMVNIYAYKEIGLEAAIVLRIRNRILVKFFIRHLKYNGSK